MILVEQSGRQWFSLRVAGIAQYRRYWKAVDNGEICGDTTMRVRLRMASLKAEAASLVVQLKGQGAA